MSTQNCDKCGNVMTPTVLFTSTVYDCTHCVNGWLTGPHPGQITSTPLNIHIPQIGIDLTKWVTKAEALASGPGPYEQGWADGVIYERDDIPAAFKDKGDDHLGATECLGWRRKQ